MKYLLENNEYHAETKQNLLKNMLLKGRNLNVDEINQTSDIVPLRVALAVVLYCVRFVLFFGILAQILCYRKPIY